MNDIVRHNPTGIPALAMDESELMKALQSSLYPGAQPESIKLVIGWCRATGKDPMKKPVHIVPMQVTVKEKDASGKVTERKEYRDVIMPGIGDYRTDAARTGSYAGISEAKFGPPVKGDWNDVHIEYPEWCEVVVYRMVGGQKCDFSSGKVRWKETYATKGDIGCPNAMWQKRPYGQLEKCAEAMALRRAFPEVGALPTAEEMQGRAVDIDELPDVTTAEKPPEAPKRKSEAAKPEATEPKPEAKPVIEGESTRVPDAGGEMPKSTGPHAMVNRKLQAEKISTAQLMEGLKLPADTKVEQLTIEQVNSALTWINAHG